MDWHVPAVPVGGVVCASRESGPPSGVKAGEIAALLNRRQHPIDHRASEHTCDTYAHAFRLLFQYAASRLDTTPSRLHLEQIDAPLVLAFLRHIETERKNGPVTRNARLSAIKSFMRYVEYQVPSALEQVRQILAIPIKKTDTKLVAYLTLEEMQAILNVPSPHTRFGIRDRAMLDVCFVAGLRVSELVGLKAADVTFEPKPFVRILGKGRRERVLPVWKRTGNNLRAWLAIRGEAAVPELFLNARGDAMTRTGFEYVLDRHVESAKLSCPSLCNKRVSPHTLRHGCAMWDKEHPVIVYDYTPTRERAGPEEFLRGYRGYLQADAYGGYDAFFKNPARGLIEVGCWAHARRYFHKAVESDQARMGPALLLIAQLYRVEKEARPLPSADRLRLRQLQSRPTLDKLRDYLLEIQAEVLPKSPEGRAVRYTLKNWTALTRYCDDGDLEIDNNATERAIRGVAVGRNNWVFFGSDQGGTTAAVLRSFVATCQQAGVDPFTWLKDILSRIAAHPITRLAELLPHNWAPAQA
jgi:integrase/recombinase XerD